MKRKEYEREMRVLHGELLAMQEWSRRRARICDVRRAGTPPERRHDQGDHRAGQPARLPGRSAPAPTQREKSQMYIQRYLPHFPAVGEVVIFDRTLMTAR